MDETKAIQEKIRDVFGLAAKDKEVAVTYKDEADTFGQEAESNVKVVRMDKERPAFFSQQLLQKSTNTKAKDETTTTVRPSGLG
jgi:large subunit ribosomal protein L32